MRRRDDAALESVNIILNIIYLALDLGFRGCILLYLVTNYGLCAKIDVGTNGMTVSGSAQMFNCVRRE